MKNCQLLLKKYNEEVGRLKREMSLVNRQIILQEDKTK